MSTAVGISRAINYLKIRDFDGAFAASMELLESNAADFQALQVIALIKHQKGSFDEALDFFRRALKFAPTNPEVNFNFGNLLMHLGRPEDAIAAYEIAASRVNDDPLILCNLGAALGSVGRITRSIEVLRKALDLSPLIAEARQSLASNLMLSGENRLAIDEFEKAICCKAGPYPNAEIGLLFSLTASSDRSREEVWEAHRDWGRKVAVVLPADSHRFAVSREPHRPLRVGFVSSDFKEHSISAFLEPLLASSCRGSFEFFAFSETTEPDVVTSRLRGYFSVWRDMHGMTDRRWADVVRSDAIDVLIDLSGHTTGSRLRAFNLRPAPVQVSWLGYPNTTGLMEMDFRITDEICDPVGIADKFHTERLVRLPGGAWCFRPRDGSPEVRPRSADSSAGTVFACFNAVHKYNETVLSVWAGLLNTLPSSSLLLKAAAFSDEGVRANFSERFRRLGVAPDRVRFAEYAKSMTAHLSNYDEADVALDTFPYAGTTTTFEALYMGVPVVTMCGASHASRVGASILSRLGRPQWIAHSHEEYVEIALALARDKEALNLARRTLRPQLQSSVLMDQGLFAKSFGGAIRSMWMEWCLR